MIPKKRLAIRMPRTQADPNSPPVVPDINAETVGCLVQETAECVFDVSDWQECKGQELAAEEFHGFVRLVLLLEPDFLYLTIQRLTEMKEAPLVRCSGESGRKRGDDSSLEVRDEDPRLEAVVHEASDASQKGFVRRHSLVFEKCEAERQHVAVHLAADDVHLKEAVRPTLRGRGEGSVSRTVGKAERKTLQRETQRDVSKRQSRSRRT